jgi:hypothetical protein
MSTVIALDRRPNPPPGVSAEDFIAAAGARLSDRIIVAGAAHLELLISLTRRGFMSAICQSPSRSPHIPNSKADAILAPAVTDEASLVSILDGLGSELRPGGALVVEAAPVFDPATAARLRPALLARGFAALESAGGALWRARKDAAPMVRAA